MSHLKTTIYSREKKCLVFISSQQPESKSHVHWILLFFVFIICNLRHEENYIFSRTITEFISTEFKDGCCSLILQMKIIKLVT